MSDSCHIPSDKEVRYAWSEVKLQEQSGFWSAVQKMGATEKAYGFISSSYNGAGKKRQVNVSKEDKHQ